MAICYKQVCITEFYTFAAVNVHAGRTGVFFAVRALETDELLT